MTVIEKEAFVKLKNPYTFGVPVSREGEFFGRKEELQRIFDTLENAPRGQKQDLVVLGPRRIGKSSLLRRLKILLIEPDSDFAPAYIDVQNVLPREPHTLFIKILREISKGYQTKGIDDLPEFETLRRDDIPTDLEFLTFSEDMERLNQAIADGNLPRLVLMFDEVELLLDFGGIDILEFLRSLIQAMNYSVFIVAGSDRLYSLTQDYGSPFYNIFKTVELSPLTPDAARELVEKPAARVGLEITGAQVDRILSYAGNTPYFIQGICHYLVEELNEQQRHQVYADDVDKVSLECVNYLSPLFAYFWNAASRPQRVVLYAMAKIGYPQTTGGLISKFPAVKIVLPSRQDQQDAFDNLVQQQILRKEAGGCYWFTVPLFVDWILARLDDEEAYELANTLRTGEVQDTSTLRRFLTLAFSDEELQDFIFDAFYPVSQQLSRGMSKGQIIEHLVDYAVQNNQVNKLLTEAKARHPQQYATFKWVVGMLGDTGPKPASTPGLLDRMRLRQLLVQHFTEEELRNLLEGLGVDYDLLSGASKLGKAAEFVAYMERHQRLDELMNDLQRQRPHVSWPAEDSGEARRVSLTKLHELLVRHFDQEELRSLLFDLGVDFDALRGEGKAAKARELILYLERRGRLNDLVNKLQRLRPNVSWEMDDSKSPRDAVAGDAITPGVESRTFYAELHRRLVANFDEDELRTLAFNLGIDYDMLVGKEILDKARELVTYMERRDRLDELIEACRQLRPHVEW
jgi:AAA+ ATPase superfamily predicted ATPase